MFIRRESEKTFEELICFWQSFLIGSWIGYDTIFFKLKKYQKPIIISYSFPMNPKKLNCLYITIESGKNITKAKKRSQ